VFVGERRGDAALLGAFQEADLNQVGLVDFFERHGFLNVDNRPVWQAVKGGSREYVRKLLTEMKADGKLSTPDESIRRRLNEVEVCTRTGEVHFEERLRAGGDGFSASPVSDGRHLFFPSEQGDLYVVRAGKVFGIVSADAMNETVMASPALSGGRLLIRTRGHLVAIGDPR